MKQLYCPAFAVLRTKLAWRWRKQSRSYSHPSRPKGFPKVRRSLLQARPSSSPSQELSAEHARACHRYRKNEDGCSRYLVAQNLKRVLFQISNAFIFIDQILAQSARWSIR